MELSSISTPRTQTPLVNLFSYLRDLYHSAEQALVIDPRQPRWPVQDWLTYASADAPGFHFQAQSPQRPLLQVRQSVVPTLNVPPELEPWLVIQDDPGGSIPKLGHRQQLIGKFESDAQRELLFQALYQTVEGKSPEAVAQTAIPQALRGWIEVKVCDGKIRLRKKDQTTAFADDELRVNMYQAFERVFYRYHRRNWVLPRVNTLYQSLHALHYSLNAHPSLNLFLSFGLVSGKIGKQYYRNYLFHVPLRLELHQQTLEIGGDALEQPVVCEPSFFPLLKEHFTDDSPETLAKRQTYVLDLAERLNQKQLPFRLDADYLEEQFFLPAKEILSVFPSCEFLHKTEEALRLDFPQDETDALQFHFAPVVQVKALDAQLLVARDAEHIIQKLGANPEATRIQIPDFFQKLFSTPGETSPLSVGSPLDSPLEDIDAPLRGNTRFLFPLPYNKEQLAIAQRLEKEDAVTVMGPPGTGKSHTIANITSHYVAQGKNVLVVSKNAKALEVVREKLPGEIQNLAVSLVGKDSLHESLKQTIDSIKENLAKNYHWNDILQLEQQLDQLDQEQEDIMQAILASLKQATQPFTLINPVTQEEETRDARSWAQWWKEQPGTRLFIKDDIRHDQEMQQQIEWISRYIHLSNGFSQHAYEWEQYEYPERKGWISPEEFQHLADRIDALQSIISERDYEAIDPTQADEELLQGLQPIKEAVAFIEEEKAWVNHPLFRQHILRDLFDRNKRYITLLEVPFTDHKVDLGPLANEEPEEALEGVQSLIQKFAGQNTLSLLKRKTLSGKAQRFFQCKVDDLSVKTLSQLGILEEYLQRQLSIKRLNIVLSNYFESMGITYAEDQLQETIQKVRRLLDTFEQIAYFNQELEKRRFPMLDPHCAKFSSQIAFIEHVKFYDILVKQKGRIEEGIGQLEDLQQARTTPLVAAMIKALKSLDPDAYRQLHVRYGEQAHVVGELRRGKELLQKIRQHLPKTAEHLETRVKAAHAQTLIPGAPVIEQIRQECFTLKVSHYLQEVLGANQGLNQQFHRYHQLSEERHRIVEQLVVHQAWYFKANSISDTEKSALTAWRNDLINIGKGHGKNTARNLESAVGNMKKARAVVPIWIMQQDHAMTYFPDPEPGQFDLLIIDEASQCDISMLNLIFRAKKTMIVGDENQTSVTTQPSQFPLERTNQLLDRYLHDHPFKQQFNINNRTASIYTLSGVIYPNIVALQEHFRCHPAIIGFSNKVVYNGSIIPLKTPGNALYGKPLQALYVEDDPKDKGKPGIVGAVIREIESYIVRFEAGELPLLPSIGILCLESSNELHQEQLIQALAAHKKIRQYEDDLRLLVGTSRRFQGDERDVMLLTSTVSGGHTPGGKIRAPRAVMGEEMMRIYNVAASRAKSRSVIFHNLEPEMLAATNPVCYRKRLIEYHQMADDAPEAQTGASHQRPQTALQTAICDFLEGLELPMTIQTHFPVGNTRVDIALLHESRRLGIQLMESDDPEEIQAMIERQLVLERVGWRFFNLAPISWIQAEAASRQAIRQWLGSFA